MAAALEIHITTFNCGRALADTDHFASSLATSFQAGSLPPDLLVLALQEIAPIGISFLGGSLLAPYYARFTEAVADVARWKFGDSADAAYDTVLVKNAGMTAIMVFARRGLRERIGRLDSGSTGVGFCEMGNKGAVGVRVGVAVNEEADDEMVPVTFVAAHLAPMEDKWERRNADWKTICQTLVFEPVNVGKGDGSAATADETEPLLASGHSPDDHWQGIFHASSPLFFAGDLNYRTSDTPPASPQASDGWPQPNSTPDQLAAFLAKDQLSRERLAKRTLHQLTESTIAFPPTYKYSSAAQRLATESATREDSSSGLLRLDSQPTETWFWAKHRVPSWCDRILYLEAYAPDKVHAYTALPVQPTSDHRPVTLSVSMALTPRSKADAEVPPFPIDPSWQARRAAARRLEIVVGVGAYLGLTTQGQTLLGGTVVGLVLGYVVFQYLLTT